MIVMGKMCFKVMRPYVFSAASHGFQNSHEQYFFGAFKAKQLAGLGRQVLEMLDCHLILRPRHHLNE